MPPMDLTLTTVARLLLAALLGGLIGLEREFHRKPAGLRTNLFICVGSAMFTILSEEIATRLGGDHGRIASQIIPGIGFIGAGAIIRERGNVVGLTTAATIFVVASVGMATGMGMYVTAVFSALLILSALTALGWAEDRFSLKTRLMTFRLTTGKIEGVVSEAHRALEEMQVQMQHFQVFRLGQDFVMEFDAELSHTQQQQLLGKLGLLEARCELISQDQARE